MFVRISPLRISRGRIQPSRANPDGTYTGFRIISPRVFILSATFEL